MIYRLNIEIFSNCNLWIIFFFLLNNPTFIYAGTYIIKVSEETLMMLEHHIVNVQQLAYSPLKTAFEDEINEWERKLNLTEKVLNLWIEVQR